MKPESTVTQVRSAFVGGLFAVMTACITGVFLIANTLIQNGFIIVGPSVQAGQVGGDVAEKQPPGPDGASDAAARFSGWKGADADAQPISGEGLNTFVKAGTLVCLAARPVEAQTAGEPVRFSGDKHPAIVCWIGPQRAQATGFSNGLLKQVDIAGPDSEETAFSVAQAWAKDLGRQVDIALIQEDGSVMQP